MTRSIRRRLQWWYGAVYAVSLIVFGCLVYWRADRDVHERATLQAIATVQYLDVSLRGIRPHMARPGERAPSEDFTNHSVDPFPSDFVLGPLPPELQFRPRPLPGPRIGPSDQPFGRPEGSRDERRPDHPGARSLTDRANDFQQAGRPDGNEPNDRPPVDRMEFAIWKSDGSILTQSDGPRVEEFMPATMPVATRPGPEVTRTRRLLNVVRRGPHGSTILVMRPMDHDLQRLHHFGFQILGLASLTLVIGIAGGWWVSGRMIQPIQQISDTASEISVANLDRRIETKDLDQELVPLASVLNQTFERLEQSFGQLTQFTADASHELRTPLAVIQSQVELALSQPRTPESYQKTLATCLRSSERMRSLVDGLLLLARTDAERLDLRPEEIDLRNSVEDAVIQLESKATLAGVELVCHVPDDSVLIHSDARFIGQIPMNLIDNAIQHTPTGGKISVAVTLSEGFATLTVVDTGCGISPEHLPHIFERFYRVDTARSRANGGSGLGLAICKSLVEAQGGSIHCVSELGKGSTFTVKWPACTSAQSIEGNQT